MRVFGWKSTATAPLYTEASDLKRLAMEAMHKLGTNRHWE
jgi:hypothetical protein